MGWEEGVGLAEEVGEGAEGWFGQEDGVGRGGWGRGGWVAEGAVGRGSWWAEGVGGQRE